MAFQPSESPAVTVREVDLSGIVPAVTSSTGAIAGDFNWGPAETARRIGNEAELAATFGSPSLVADSNNIDFLSAANFLKYSGSLQVSRAISSTLHKNAQDSAVADLLSNSKELLVKNLADWEEDNAALRADARFIAKYPGEAGSSLLVSYVPWSGLAVNGGDVLVADSAFENWGYKQYFDGAPNTSEWTAARSADGDQAHDEIHLVVVDAGGKFSGTPGTVLETWPFLSLAKDAKAADGTSISIKDVLNNKSSYLWVNSINSNIDLTKNAADWGQAQLGVAVQDEYVKRMDGGKQPAVALTRADLLNGYDAFENVDDVQVDMLIAPSMATAADQKLVIEDLELTARTRKDCVVVASPAREDVVGKQDVGQTVTDVAAFSDTLPSSSYLVFDNNFLKVYDKYNDEYVFIPASSGTAGLMAATDFVAAPWFSPAGSRRGQYFGVSSLAYNATKSQRDTLYKANVNPIVNLPGQGVLLFGDKTHLNRPSAFDRINVRRLFLVMERAIKTAAENVMFEFNDEFTRAEFVNIVEPFLREIKGRRGITDFRVVCDETNNTSQVIDNNQFVADIFVKPARSINYVTLSFVAVRTGVDFDEVVGLA
ncbi:phage tail sheath subtilisin-like domain-containing protein [bacterium]|nr:phage tail sheath subtilisin-like domain-containing protein [bacterium]